MHGLVIFIVVFNFGLQRTAIGAHQRVELQSERMREVALLLEIPG